MDGNEIGALKRIYLGDNLSPGRIIALEGQKGPQFNVLKPGKYRINLYLFRVQKLSATDVPTGHVAVIRSNVKTSKEVCPDPSVTVGTADKAVCA